MINYDEHRLQRTGKICLNPAKTFVRSTIAHHKQTNYSSIVISILPFSYQIRRSSRATRTRIVVTEDKVEVVAPPKVPEPVIAQFVQSKQQWIVQALAKMAEKSGQHRSFAPAVYGDGAEIPFQGDSYRLTLKESKLKRIKIEFSHGFIAHVPSELPAQSRSDAIKDALIRWMKKETKSRVERLVERHGARKRLYPLTIKIKTQKSRWGSCGIHNDININWLLVLAPPEVLEYVVVHELCHIKVRNHSPAFWSLVAEHLPDYPSRRQWLKKHGTGLMKGL